MTIEDYTRQVGKVMAITVDFEIMNIEITSLLPKATCNILKRAWFKEAYKFGKEFNQSLNELSDAQILSTKGIGKVRLQEIRQAINKSNVIKEQ